LTDEHNNNPISVSEGTEIRLPLKSIIAIAVASALFMAEYVILNDRIETLEEAVVRDKVNVDLNTEFRIFWPRGDLGQLPEDVEQSIRLDHIESDIVKMFHKVEKLAVMTMPLKDHNAINH